MTFSAALAQKPEPTQVAGIAINYDESKTGNYKNGPTAMSIPAAGDASNLNTLGYYMHKGGHGTVPGDWDIFVDFLKKIPVKMKNVKCLLVCAALSLLSFISIPGKEKPTLFLIGDSTVRNGSKRRWRRRIMGMGKLSANLFDTTKITVENRALGGTSSLSYVTNGLWNKTLARLKPGDFVMMQFGHNDNGKTTLKGNGEDTIHIYNAKTKEVDVIHSFGWNIRKYISETKAKGATPIVCSLIPRNRWTDGKVNRDNHSHGEWAKMAAEQEHVSFVDLNTIISDHYDKTGQNNVQGVYFDKDAVHTIEAGAKENAVLVVEGLKSLKDNPLKKYMLKRPKPLAEWKYIASKDPRLD